MYRLLPLIALLAFLSVSTATEECMHHVCMAAFLSCSNVTGHNAQDCLDWADDTFHCCDDCQTCTSFKSKHGDEECRENLCNKVVGICTHVHSQNSTECQERADVATNCCYNCLDCPSDAESKTHHRRPRYDHCLSDMCDTVFAACTQSEHSPDRCRKVANHASDCCNMCDDCRTPPADEAKPKYDHCLQDLCDGVIKACGEHTNHTSTECREVANSASHCCNMCEDCRQ